VVSIRLWQSGTDVQKARCHLPVMLWYGTSALSRTHDGNAFHGRKSILEVVLLMQTVEINISPPVPHT
jgi:hypothetical protein